MLTLLLMLQGLSGPAIDLNDPIIGLLFALVAASAHIIVPAAVFNLKVSLSFKRGRKSHDYLMFWVQLACQVTYTPPSGCWSPWWLPAHTPLCRLQYAK